MAYSDISNRVSFAGYPDGSTFPAEAEAAIKTIYEGSALAASAIDAWLATHPNQNITIEFLAGQAQAIPGASGHVQIDPAYFSYSYYISEGGTAVADSFVSGLTHELGHALNDTRDNDRYDHLSGDNIDLVNPWFTQLGFEEQASYEAYVTSPGLIQEGYNYTLGRNIANAILDRGTIPSGDQVVEFNTTSVDLAANGVQGPTLVIGSGLVNEYHGTDSYDFIYGQGGDDKLYGGTGDDYVDGGTDKDDLHGDQGNDIIEGDAGSDTMFGDDGKDTLSGYLSFNQRQSYVDDNAKDTMHGGDGDDHIYGYGADLLFGDDGDDALRIENPTAGNVLEGGTGNDRFELITSSGFSGATLVIADSDWEDRIYFNGDQLVGGSGIWETGPAPTEVTDGFGNKYTNDVDSARLTIELSNGGTIIVNDFEYNDLGIRFDSVDSRASNAMEQDTSGYAYQEPFHIFDGGPALLNLSHGF